MRELPQFLNVFFGQMSFVGPQSEMKKSVDLAAMALAGRQMVPRSLTGGLPMNAALAVHLAPEQVLDGNVLVEFLPMETSTAPTDHEDFSLFRCGVQEAWKKGQGNSELSSIGQNDPERRVIELNTNCKRFKRQIRHSKPF